MAQIYDIKVKTIDGEIISLEKYKNKVLLIVNVASQCAFTRQYIELEQLYRQYQDKDFVILAFPCNQFGKQEPGSESEITQFCKTNYQVTFPLFAKIKVNGKNAHELYQYLQQAKPGLLGTTKIKWNFTKFLINKKGSISNRFAPFTKISVIEKAVVKLIC